jgi:hypothetical protein
VLPDCILLPGQGTSDVLLNGFDTLIKKALSHAAKSKAGFPASNCKKFLGHHFHVKYFLGTKQNFRNFRNFARQAPPPLHLSLSSPILLF